MGIVQSTVSSPEAAAAVAGAVVAGTTIAAAYSYRIVTRSNGAEESTTTEAESKSDANLRRDEKGSARSTTDRGGEAGQNAAGAREGVTKKANKKKKGASAASTRATSVAPDTVADKEFEQVIAAARRENADVVARAALTSARRPDLEEPEKSIPGGFGSANSGSALLLQRSQSDSASEKKEGRKKKGKKSGGGNDLREPRTAPTTASSSPQIDTDVSLVELPPLAISSIETAPVPSRSASRKKRKDTKGTAGEVSTYTKAGFGTLAPTSTRTSKLEQSVTLSDVADDESWTRVTTRRRTQAVSGVPNASSTKATTLSSNDVATSGTMTESEVLTSDTNLTASHTEPDEADDDNEDEVHEESAQESGQRATHEPSNERTATRKTGAEDVEEVPLEPTLARVMRVKPDLGSTPAQGFSWGDYEEYAHGDDGTSADGDADDAWEEVKSKKRTKANRAGTSSSAIASSVDSLPARVSESSETLSRNQRKHLKKREAAKAEKEAQEKDRLQRLSQHNRELVQARISEQYKSSEQSGKKNVSGGMTASVDAAGKLVWE